MQAGSWAHRRFWKKVRLRGANKLCDYVAFWLPFLIRLLLANEPLIYEPIRFVLLLVGLFVILLLIVNRAFEADYFLADDIIYVLLL